MKAVNALNIGIKFNGLIIQLSCLSLSRRYLDNRVFVSLANGELVIYSRDQSKHFKSITDIFQSNIYLLIE